MLVRVVALVLCMVTVLSMVTFQASALTPTYTPSESYRSGQYYQQLKNVQLTGDPRTDMVNIAKSQVGYLEGNSNSQLSGTGNGTKNYTEYGKWYGMQDMWCAMFVSWVANQAGVSTKVVPKTASTVTGLDTFINAGRAYTRKQVANGNYVPKAGDIIYFKSDRNNNKTNHVGIVTGYSNNTVYTIEGNYTPDNVAHRGGVYEASYKISNTYIVYICSPKYSGSSSNATPAPVTPAPAPEKTNGSYYPACASGHTSIVNALNSIGVDSSYAFRKQIAKANGISGYSGTAAQNVQMLNLLKSGKLIKP